MTDSNKAALFTKLARVMGKLGPVSKDGYNESFRYSFIRDVDVANALRPLLAEEGVALLVGMVEVEQQEITSSSGSTGYHTIAHMMLTFADGETGESISIPWVGEANDYQDKSVNKAATAGLKYALLKTFLIGSDEDPDGGPQPQARPRPKRKAQASGHYEDDEDVLGFGKHADETWAQVAANDPGYLEWIIVNMDKPEIVARAQAALDEPHEADPVVPPEPEPQGNDGNYDSTAFWSLYNTLGKAAGVERSVAGKIAAKYQESNDWQSAYADLSALIDSQ